MDPTVPETARMPLTRVVPPKPATHAKPALGATSAPKPDPGLTQAQGLNTPPDTRKWCGICANHVAEGEILPCCLEGRRPKAAHELCPLKVKAKNEAINAAMSQQPEAENKASEKVLLDLIAQQAAQQSDHFPGMQTNNTPMDIKAEIANEAVRITNGARRGAYGKPERNFQRIAHLWNVYLELRNPEAYGNAELDNNPIVVLEPKDIPAMMRLMKEARLLETPDHKDSFTDIVGYTLCQAEMMGAR